MTMEGTGVMPVYDLNNRTRSSRRRRFWRRLDVGSNVILPACLGRRWIRWFRRRR